MKKEKKFDVHHVFPRSRFPEHRRSPWNLRMTNRVRHARFHSLFGSATPCEAALMLLQEFGALDQSILLDDPAINTLLGFLKQLKGRRRQ